MSSKVPRSKRQQKPARLKLEDFSDIEQQIIAAARSWFPGRVSVFGSRAAGYWAEDSDLDLGVDGYHSVKHRQVRDHISGLFGMRVDFRNFDSVAHRKETVTVWG